MKGNRTGWLSMKKSLAANAGHGESFTERRLKDSPCPASADTPRPRRQRSIKDSPCPQTLDTAASSGALGELLGQLQRSRTSWLL